MSQSYEDKKAIATRVTLWGMLLDIVLGLLKILVGLVGHSQALVADGIHSLTDAASDIMVIVVARYAHQAPDYDHPYGHGKIETLGTVALGSLLIAVAGALGYDGILRLFQDQPLQAPEWPVLVIAALSIISKEWIFRYTLKHGKALNSDLLIANAWHSRSDALSSIVVFLAVLGAMAGMTWLDIIGAVVIAIMVARIGWQLAWKGMRELVESAVSEETLTELQAAADRVPQTRGVHSLRARQVGPDVVVDLHLQVPPRVSVSEGHYIGLIATKALRKANRNVSDVTFHIDAEEDGPWSEQSLTVDQLPERPQVEQVVSNLLKTENRPATEVPRLLIHYLKGGFEVELFLGGGLRPEGLETKLQSALKPLSGFRSLKIWTEWSDL